MLKRSKSHCQFRERRQLRTLLQLQNLNNQKCHLQQSNQRNQNTKLLQKLLNTLRQPKITLLLKQDLKLFLRCTISNLLTSHKNQFTECHNREFKLQHSPTQSPDLPLSIWTSNARDVGVKDAKRISTKVPSRSATDPCELEQRTVRRLRPEPDV